MALWELLSRRWLGLAEYVLLAFLRRDKAELSPPAGSLPPTLNWTSSFRFFSPESVRPPHHPTLPERVRQLACSTAPISGSCSASKVGSFFSSVEGLFSSSSSRRSFPNRPPRPGHPSFPRISSAPPRWRYPDLDGHSLSSGIDPSLSNRLLPGDCGDYSARVPHKGDARATDRARSRSRRLHQH